MKNLHFPLSLLLSVFFILNILSQELSALTLPHTDNFDGSKDSWSRDDGDLNTLQINHDKESHKTFDFTSSYANTSVTVTLSLKTTYTWEKMPPYQDYFRVQFNDGILLYESEVDGIYTKTYQTTLDSDGQLKISLSVDSTQDIEIAQIDYVTIESNAPTTPTITPDTFTIFNEAPDGTLIGTILSSGEPNSFSILSGDTDNIFSVNNNGEITVASYTNLVNASSTSYTLEISASNDIGSTTEYFVINIVDDIALSTEDINTRAFTNVPILGKNSVTINGSILQIGNQLLCRNANDGDTCQAPSTTDTQNNFNNQHKAKIDTSVDAPSSNTMAKLVMQEGDEVIFARLYWSARINYITTTQKEDAKTLQLKGPQATTYTPFTSPNTKYNWHKSGDTFDYVASQDVTEYIKAQGAGEYYAGDIVASDGYGQYASWQLIVVVENASRSLKNISIFDGFYSVFDGYGYPDYAIADASGFITPTGSDPFNANLFIYMGESDDGFDDNIKLLKKDGDENILSDWLSLVDGANTINDIVNASIYSLDYTGGYRSNDVGMANPNFKNVLGVDIDKLPINIKEDTSKQILSNSQVSTKIKITSEGDRFSLNMFAFETEVFVPEFCYDYAYSQYEQYFTEDNNGTAPPRLTGTVSLGEPIQVSIFVKSLVDSTIAIDNMSIDISDINRTQATYISDTTQVALVGDLVPQDVSVTAGTTLDGEEDYIHNIEIGSLNQNDYFYVYYKLDPLLATMDMPMTIEATYDLTLDSTAVEYKLKLSEDIPMCSYNNFHYLPAKGIFNVVHNDYYTNTSIDKANPNGDTYYNIPTQVTSREGNFKIISLNSDDYDELVGRSTVVAVEIIDAGAYHYTDASCKELESAITQRVWMVFENNITSVSFDKTALETAITDGMTNITKSSDFYGVARANSAFRVTYNSMDSNDSVPYLEKDNNGMYNLLNWRMEWSGETCTQDMDNNPSNNDQVADYCNLTGGSTKEQLFQCMECIYGKETHYLCSRDNFSLRPEAFLLKIDDQNQTDSNSKQRIADDVSGVSTPNITQTELASGYNYLIEINATNHLNNEVSLGYTKIFSTDSLDTIEYKYTPSVTLTGCNDTNNITLTPNIIDGYVEFNSSLSQVGEYTLSMLDTTWTTVDSNPLYMTHHDSSAIYFLPSSTPDCLLDTSTTQVVNSSIKNGCNISSNHDSSGSTLKYRDYKLEFHPYKFDLSTIGSFVGANDSTINSDSYIYMANVAQDEDISYHLNGVIRASGYNGAVLSNFVSECYAKAIDMNLTRTMDDVGDVAYQYKFNSRALDNTTLFTNIGDLNNSTNPIHLDTTYFSKEQNGSINSNLNLNYKREINHPINPKNVQFHLYSAECSTPSQCSFNADLTSKTTQGELSIDNNISYYYARTHASRQRYTEDIGTANIYYETYCFKTDSTAKECDKTLLQQGLNSKNSDDLRWFINENHTKVFGTAGVVVEKNSLNRVSVSGVTTGNHPDNSTPMSYDKSRGYPYKTTMENNASRWLIYNESNPSSSKNSFSVEFEGGDSYWNGIYQTPASTKDSTVIKSNRRSMW